MLVVRSLCREVLHTLLAVMMVLLFLVVTNMLIRAMNVAASQNIMQTPVLSIIGVTLPKFIGLLLPIALFLSVLLAYGRLFAENELLVYFSCGMSWWRLLFISMIPATMIAIIVAVLSLWVMPTMSVQQSALMQNAAEQNNISLIRPGRFVSFKGDQQVIYVGESSPEESSVKSLFIFEQSGPGGIPQLITAPLGKEGFQERGGHYFTLYDGFLYRFQAGKLDLEQIDFDEYGILIEETDGTVVPDLDGIETTELWASDDLHMRAELQWRLVLPVSVWVMACVAVAICHVRPRQGRYVKIFPGILIFIVYFNSLALSKSWVMKGVLNPIVGLWWVPTLFMFWAMSTLWWKNKT